MATLTVQNSAEGGAKTFAAAASGGDVFANDGRTILAIHNESGGALTVTVTAQETTTTKSGFGDLTKADAVQSVEATSVDIMGPFPKTAFNNSSNQCAVTYSGVGSLSVAAIKIKE